MRGKHLINTIIDILYPRRCPVCGGIAVPRGGLACTDCSSRLKPIEEPRCKKCSKPIDSEEKEYCHDCESKRYHYTNGFSLWIYDECMKKSIADFKYHGRREYGEFYVQELVKKFHDSIMSISPDVLVPVPIHKSKQLKRGYNQADILAKGIGKRLNIPVLSYLLKRDKNTLPQKQLNDKERLKNLEKAFIFDEEERMTYNGIIDTALLVDDIYTTGSTIEACTNILMQNGIKKVYFITISIGKGY